MKNTVQHLIHIAYVKKIVRILKLILKYDGIFQIKLNPGSLRGVQVTLCKQCPDLVGSLGSAAP